MKVYLVVNNETSLMIDNEFMVAGKPFELSEDKYNSLKDMVEVLGVNEIKEKAQTLEMEVLPDDYVVPVEEKPKKKTK